MIEISSFRQHKNSFEIHMANEQSYFSVAKYLPIVPESLQWKELEKYQDLELKKSDNNLVAHFNFPESEPDLQEYSIILIDSTMENYFEIVRQSEEFLIHRFGFKRLGGYCIAGRRNFRLGRDEKLQKASPRVFFGKVEVPISQRTSDKRVHFNELEVAKEILEWMCAKKLNTGPIGKNHKKYDLARFSKKITMLEQGKYAVQCSGFRDLFVHAAVSCGLTVNSVDAYNYSPRFPDLVTYGHSLCEVWISNLQKSVIFDPWLCGLMVNVNDSPIGVGHLQALQVERMDLSAMLPRIERIIINGAGQYNSYTFHSAQVGLKTYLFNKEIGSCMPGYIEYFNHVVIRKIIVKKRPFICLAIAYDLAGRLWIKLVQQMKRITNQR